MAGITGLMPEATADDVARAALTGRREVVLLDDPSVRAMTRLLVSRWRSPAPWVRAAVATLDRFAREVAAGDLPGLLQQGQADSSVAVRSLEQLARRHDGLTGSQLASLSLGPKLWWTAAHVDVPWRPVSEVRSATPPIPSALTDADVRLLLLAVIGSGATQEELLQVRVRDAGRLDANGVLVPDLYAEPLAVSYPPADGGAPHLTFLSYEARQALLDGLVARATPGPDEPLLLSQADAEVASVTALRTARSLIDAGNEVNVTTCRATGDFFREWGMPGARFDPVKSAQFTGDAG